MTFASTPVDRFSSLQVRKMHFSSKYRIENLSSKSSVLMEYATTVCFFHEMSRATQWGGEKAKLLPWVGNHQLSRGAPYLTKQLPIARWVSCHRCCLNDLQDGCWHGHEDGWREEETGRKLWQNVGSVCGLKRLVDWEESDGEMYIFSFIGVELHWINWFWMNKELDFSFCEKEWEGMKIIAGEVFYCCWRKWKNITNI